MKEKSHHNQRLNNQDFIIHPKVLRETTRKVIIIGAGISGTALALFLKQAGIEVTIYEAYPDPTNKPPVGGAFQVAPNGMRVLARLGLEQKAIEKGSTTTAMRFRNHKGLVLADVNVQRAELYGYPAVNMSRQTLYNILLDEVIKQGIDIQFNKRLKQIERFENQPICIFEDGTQVEGYTVIGADGIHSRVRESIVPNCPKIHYTGVYAFNGFIHPRHFSPGMLPKPHTAEKIFGYLGFFGYSYTNQEYNDHSITWWTTLHGDEIPKQNISSMSDEDIRNLLLKIYAGWVPPVENIIKNSTSNILMLNLYEVPPLSTWSRGRVGLTGDAAHAVSPNAGQGSAMALEDAAYLSMVLTKYFHSPEIAFQKFEESRRERAEKVVEIGRRNSKQRRTLGPVRAWIRDRMVSFMMPRVLKKDCDWLYKYEVSESEKSTF